WNCVESPEQVTGLHIPTADITRRSGRRFAHAAMGNQYVLVKTRRTNHCYPVVGSRSAQLSVEIHRTFDTEVEVELAGIGIELVHHVGACDDDPTHLAIRPEGNAARITTRERGWRINPFGLARGGIQRIDSFRAHAVENAVHHNRLILNRCPSVEIVP